MMVSFSKFTLNIYILYWVCIITTIYSVKYVKYMK